MSKKMIEAFFEKRHVNQLMNKLNKLSKGEMSKVIKPVVRKETQKINKVAKSNAKINIKGLTISKMIVYKTWSKKGSIFGRVMFDSKKKLGGRTIEINGRVAPFDVVGYILEYGSLKNNVKARHFMKRAHESEGKKAVNNVKEVIVDKLKNMESTGKI